MLLRNTIILVVASHNELALCSNVMLYIFVKIVLKYALVMDK